jgi:hypothetical protein
MKKLAHYICREQARYQGDIVLSVSGHLLPMGGQ